MPWGWLRSVQPLKRGPFLIGWSIDHFIRPGNLQGLLLMLGLLVIYVSGIQAIRAQIYQWAGSCSIYSLSCARTFTKIQSLPISFFDRSEAEI